MQTEQIDLTGRIELMPQLEQKWGVRFEGLFAEALPATEYDDDGLAVPSGCYEIVVNGEVHTSKRPNLSQSLDVVITLHDDRGRVLAKLVESLDAEEFFALRAFSCSQSEMRAVPSRIRVYAQAT